ncbi:MAG: hypothetical protein GXO71_04420 [Caldiserica bacterium]|nr:hypothetical protein [Caldisericota bacterium]
MIYSCLSPLLIIYYISFVKFRRVAFWLASLVAVRRIPFPEINLGRGVKLAG